MAYTISGSDGQVLLTAPEPHSLADELEKAVRAGTDLNGAFLYLGNNFLQGRCLRGAKLRNAYMCNLDLTEVDLSGADLRGANLSRADLTRANLVGAKVDKNTAMERTTFAYADLRRVEDMSEINLVSCNLYRCKLPHHWTEMGLSSLLWPMDPTGNDRIDAAARDSYRERSAREAGDFTWHPGLHNPGHGLR